MTAEPAASAGRGVYTSRSMGGDRSSFTTDLPRVAARAVKI